MTKQHFPYRFDRRWTALFFALGVGDDDGVDIFDNGDFIATYGRVNVKTTLDNIDHTLVTGPHRWYTAVGLRLSVIDDGLTFGTNHHMGLSIAFVEATTSPGLAAIVAGRTGRHPSILVSQSRATSASGRSATHRGQ